MIRHYFYVRIMQLYFKVLCASLFSLICSVIMGFLGYPYFLEMGIRKQFTLQEGTYIRQVYLKLPFALNFSVYFFNVSNPMEVMEGKTPILKEVGPYTYDLWKERRNIIEDESEDSLTYSPYDRLIFNPVYSAPRTEDDYVTILNPILVGMVNIAAKLSPAILNIVEKAIPLIFNDPQTIYLTVKVRDLLFDGMTLNCTSKQFAASAVCAQVKTNVPGIKEPEKNIFLFSLLGTRNATLGKKVKILRGIKRSLDLGKVVEYDGKKRLKYWATKECNSFQGTDGWIFPPLTNKEDGLGLFSTDLCRNMKAEYVGPEEMHGISLNKFYADLGDQSNKSEDKCYCPSSDECLKKGVFDLMNCVGVPLYATLPHFLETDELYLNQVKGLNPDYDSHIIRVNFIQMIAVPLEVKIRTQFNLFIRNLSQIALMKTVPQALHPILWVELSVELSGGFLKKILLFFTVLNVVEIGRYVAVILSLIGIGIAGYIYRKNRKQVNITLVDSSVKLKRRKDSNVNNPEKNSDFSKQKDLKVGYDNPALEKE